MSNSAHKASLFAVYGAIGCLLGALVGEWLLRHTRSEPGPPPPDLPNLICLLVDTSGSMQGPRIAEARAAATAFISRQNFQRDRIAVARFDANSAVVAPMGSERDLAVGEIGRFVANGGTAMDLGLETAASTFGGTQAQFDRYIILFTDGQPDGGRLMNTLRIATQLRRSGHKIIAIATGGANTSYLARLTGDTRLVLWAGDGNFDAAFDAAGALIEQGTLVDGGGDARLVPSLLRIGGWTSLLAIGLGLLLIVGQNRYLRRPILTLGQLTFGTLAALIAGTLAGAAGQLLFRAARRPEGIDVIGIALAAMALAGIVAAGAGARAVGVAASTFIGLVLGAAAGTAGIWFYWDYGAIPWYMVAGGFALAGGLAASIGASAGKGQGSFGGGAILALVMLGIFYFAPSHFVPVQSFADTTSRVAGWALLGAAMGLGMSMFVPNLSRRRALLGGTIGGAVGSAAFILGDRYAGEMTARLTGAATIGFFIGLMIALAEIAFREVWLEVVYGPREKRQVNLGDRPVTVGSSTESTIYVRNIAPIAARFVRENGAVTGTDVATGRSVALKPGDRKTFGSVTVVVCGADR